MNTMNAKPDDDPLPRPRPPKGPLIVILLVLAGLAWVVWLTRTPPRPPPELPPLRQLPMDFSSPQDPQPGEVPDGPSRERQ
jgi:hypothetical protein